MFQTPRRSYSFEGSASPCPCVCQHESDVLLIWRLACSFEDSRGWCCAAYTEVAIDYNGGYTGALARLVDYFQDQQPFSDCGLDLGWSHPNATAVRAGSGKLRSEGSCSAALGSKVSS